MQMKLLLYKIFLNITKFKKKLFYKVLFYFSDNFITHNDFIKKEYLSNKKKYSGYKDFINKKVLTGKGYSIFEEKLILILITILFELSARCSSHKTKIIIISTEICLRKINQNLKNILPTDTKYLLSNDTPKDLKNIIFINLSSKKIYQDALNIFFKKENEKINVVDCSDKKNHNFPIFINEIHEYNKIKNNFKNIIVRYNNLFTKFIFSKKIYKKYSVQYEEIFNNKNQFFIKKKNINLVYKDYFKIVEEKDVILSFHGTVSKNNQILDETRKFSLRDGFYNGGNENLKKTSIPKITKVVNSPCLVLPTTGSSIGHYFLESLSTLLLIKNYNKLKIIVDNNIPKYILQILNFFKVQKINIIKKKAFESWKIKKIFFPIFNNGMVLPLSINALANFDIKNKFKKKKYKIYISRKDSNSSRILINEDEIIHELKKKNYKIYNFSELNIFQKLKIISEAKVVVAPVGAGLLNLFFSNIKKVQLFLIAGKLYFPREYIDLCYYKQFKLKLLTAKVIPSYSQWWNFEHSCLYLDKTLIKKLP